MLITFIVFSRYSTSKGQAGDDSLITVLKATTNDTSRLSVLNEIIESSDDIEVWPRFNEDMKNIAVRLLDNKDEKVRKKARESYAISLNNKGYFYNLQGKYNEALPFYEQSLKLSLEIGDRVNAGSCINNIAVIYDIKGDYITAIKYYSESYDLAIETQDSSGSAQALHNIAHLQERQGNLTEAVSNYQKSISVFRKTGDGNYLASSLNNLGMILYRQQEYQKAKEYFFEGLAICSSSHEKAGIAKAFHNLGSVLRGQDSLTNALPYLEQSLKIRREINDKRGIAYTLNEIGLVFLEQGKTQDAFQNKMEALKILKEVGDKEGLAFANIGLGNVLLKLGRLTEALQYAEAGLNISTQLALPLNIESAAGLLKYIYKQQKQYEKSLAFADLEFKMHDSILNENTRKSILQQKYTYETEKKEEQIKLLNQDNEIKSLAIQKQTVIRNSLIAASILIIMLGFLIVNRIQLRKKLEQQQAVLEERRRISTDMHDDLGSNLSKISLMSEVLKRNIHNEKEKDDLENISSSAQNALEKMSEIVWTLNPKNDKLGNLLAYIRKYSVEYFESTAILCKINFPAEIANVELTGEQRRNIFLAVKESLHNVFKHSGASLVEVKFIDESGTQTISIHDNGKGIDTNLLGKRADGTFGNGLDSMRQRMELIKGAFQVVNNKGTLINLIISKT